MPIDPIAGLGWRRGRWARVGLGLAMAFLLAGCASSAGWGYYWQAAQGHLTILRQAKPVDDVIRDPATPPKVAERLKQSQLMRDFAVRALALPDNPSYRRYVDLGRGAAVWNVTAAPEFSLELHSWCYLVLGCASYRGFYAETQARAFAQTLSAQGLEVQVAPVAAYSTLGWLPPDGFGGLFADPLTNTFLMDSDAGLAGLMFHELAHQVAYAPGDTEFNESYATAVERLGVALWLRAQSQAAAASTADAPALASRAATRRAQFRALLATTHERLRGIYASGDSADQKRTAKGLAMAQMRQAYEGLKREAWGGYAGFDERAATLNNASLGANAAYNLRVSAFENLFEHLGQDFPQFHAEVRRLAALPQPQRQLALERWAQAGSQARTQPAENLDTSGAEHPSGAAPGQAQRGAPTLLAN